MDLNKTLNRISELEKGKVQLELIVKQLKERKLDLSARLKELDITPEQLDAKIKSLEESISQRLESIAPTPVKEDALSAF